MSVSEEEAINITVEFLEDFSLGATQNGKLVKVTDFVMLDETVSIQLLSHTREKPLDLIPYYYVTVYLDKVHPGNVNNIGVGIWADTGAVSGYKTISAG